MAKRNKTIADILTSQPATPRAWVRKVPDTWWHEEQMEEGDGAPNPRQREYIDDTTSSLILYGGSVGGGKTQGSIWKITKYAWMYPGIKIAVGRRFYTEVMPMLFDPMMEYWKRLRAKYGWNFSVHHDTAVTKVTAPTGSVIEFRAFDDPKKIQGLNIHIGLWDEIGQAEEESIMELRKRIRGSLMADEATMHFPKQLLGTSNYATGYVNDRIAAPARRGELNAEFPGARFIPCLTSDQQKRYDRIAKASGQQSYMVDLVTSGAATRESIMEDGWADPEGTVWRPLTDIGEDRDIITRFEFVRDYGLIKPEDTVYFGLDHGINHPSTVIVGVFRKTKLGQSVFIVYDEWSEPLGARPHTYLAEVVARKVMPARKHRGWADSRMKHGKLQAANDTSMAPIVQIYSAGINIGKAPACKAFQKALSIHAVAEALASHVVLFVAEGTVRLREQWSGYMKAGRNARTGEDPCLPAGDATNDHMLDAFRYVISGLVEARLLILSERVMHGMSEAAPRTLTPAEMFKQRVEGKMLAMKREASFAGLNQGESLESLPGLVTKFPSTAGRPQGKFPFR